MHQSNKPYDPHGIGAIGGAGGSLPAGRLRWPASMRALLVTSRVTFVPDNYDAFVVAVAACPQVAGLLVLDNASAAVRAKAIGAAAQGARGIGWHLWRNSFWKASERRRQRAYAERGKGFWVLPTINDAAALQIVSENNFDLVVNARTRFIYKPDVLGAPRLGCINVHHGLLPDQRGVMCDLWALSLGEAAGFSIHAMTRKIDDGEVLRVVSVSQGERDFQAHLRASAAREATVLDELLREIESTGRVAGSPNAKGAQTVYRRNPTWAQIRQMRGRGMKL
jgi:methionyl-tRNA formyltransferase